MNTATLVAPVTDRQSASGTPAEARSDARRADAARLLAGRTASGRTASGGTAPGGTAPGGTAPGRTAPGRTAPARPARRSGRGTGPAARPPRPLGAPVVTVGRGTGARSCSIPAPARVAPPSSWRLTERAIALVLVTGLVVVTAALAVVGLTAVRVTGDRYHTPGSSSGVSVLQTP